jgi:hypothetical protein
MRRDHAGRPMLSTRQGAMDIDTKGLTIIANIGDQESELADGHASGSLKVPNPFYFTP